MKRALRTVSVLLIITAIITALIPVKDVEAVSSTSDFQMEGSKLVKYAGSSEVVTLPDNVRSIGEEAFSGNNSIVKVTINDRCKSIGYGAFSNCRSLRTVVTGDGVEEIDSAAFSNDAVLTNVSIGDNVRRFGSAVFAGDNALTGFSISAGNNYLKLDNNVVYDNDYEKLFFMLPTFSDGIYNMPNTVNEIKGYAFWGNTNIKNVTLSSGLYAVPAYAFSNCVNLRQVTIPLPIRSIDSLAFENCANLSAVKCPESLTYIAPNAFNGCPRVTFDAVEGSYAYKYYMSLERTPVNEIEYEDVENAVVINTEPETTVTTPPAVDDTVSGNAIEGETATDNAGSPGNSDTAQAATSSDDNNLRYSTGVINGADVVGYGYYGDGELLSGITYGSSSVVAGRALVFIDNKPSVMNADTFSFDLTVPEDAEYDENGERIPGEGAYTKEESGLDQTDERSLNDILSDNASKGISFPKFTIAGNAVATQAYYGDTSITEYDFPDGIERIGAFAFARSALKVADIPEGVTDIGYGAFYHCDGLSDVSIPSTVKHISSYAFENTPFYDNNTDTFMIVGDGVLLKYSGSDSIVNIPEGVKLIADGAFRDHKGITAVNLPDSLTVIGQEAFSGCGNLTTLNRGENVRTIGANAFKGTALNNITINPSVREIGLGAFDIKGGTDTVTFLSDELPSLVSGDAASRLSNTDDRTYAFGDLKTAVLSAGAGSLSGTVLEPGVYGFHGIVTDSFGNTVSDNTNGVSVRSGDGGITIDNNSSVITMGGVSARIAGDNESYVLHINDSQNAKESIERSYSELYGGRRPDELIGLELSLYDGTDTVPITKLGKQTVDVEMPLPSDLRFDNLHLVALDSDGQLESVPFTLSEDRKSISFRCSHFSPYGLYNYSDTADGIDYEGKTKIGKKDITPDTGDIALHPKWFLVIGCAALAAVLLLISGRRKY